MFCFFPRDATKSVGRISRYLHADCARSMADVIKGCWDLSKCSLRFKSTQSRRVCRQYCRCAAARLLSADLYDTDACDTRVARIALVNLFDITVAISREGRRLRDFFFPNLKSRDADRDQAMQAQNQKKGGPVGETSFSFVVGWQYQPGWATGLHSTADCCSAPQRR